MDPNMTNAFLQQMIQQNPYLMQSYLQFMAAQNNPQIQTSVMSQHQQNMMNQAAQNGSTQMTNEVQPTKNLYGRMINSLEEVTPKEIPMDKTPAIFPTNDLSAVYVTSWDNNFQLQKIKYIPEAVSIPEEKDGEENVFEKIMGRLDRIEAAVIGQTKKSSQNKNEKKENVDKEVES